MKIFPGFLCSTVLVLACCTVSGQSRNIDSLKAVVDTHVKDSTLVGMLNTLSVEVLQGENIEEAKTYAFKAKQLAEELNDQKGKAYALKNLGLTYYYQGDYMEVLNNWTSSLETFERLDDSLGIANLTNNLGAVYRDQGSFTRAIDYYLKSLRISEKLKDTLRIATALVNIGGVYEDNSDYDKALEYLGQLKQFLDDLDDTQIRTAYLTNSGEVYSKKGAYDKALALFEEALNLNEGTPSYAHILTQLGSVDFKLGNKERALERLDRAYTYARESQQQYEMLTALIALGNIYKQGAYQKALRTYKMAEALAVEMNADYELRDIYQGMSQAYSAKGDYKNAFAYQERYLTQKDMLFNLETDDKIRGLQFDFDLVKKQDQIGMLEQEAEITELQAKRQKIIIYGTGIALVLVFLLALGSINRYRFVKRTNRIIEEEKNRSESLLLNILPEETAAELKEHGKVAAKKFDFATVLFTDFKGFTYLSQNLSPEDLVKSVDYYFSKFDSIIEKYGLEKIKTVGDAYMCAGGLPYPSTDHPHKMVHAAFEIAAVMEEVKMTPHSGIMPFDIRIGINTGTVVAGVVGTKKFAYDIWGDAVNVAARMETMSEPGRINISENTYQQVKDTFECEYRGEVFVKNKGKMNMYFVTGQKVMSQVRMPGETSKAV